jgi:hypothetical protein
MEWISVDDKIPKVEHDLYSQKLLFYGQVNGVVDIYTGIYSDNGIWYSLGNEAVDVTHWMPVPEPPQ